MTSTQESQIKAKIAEICSDVVDPGHDFSHFERVVAAAKKLCEAERARAEVVLPAAWLHDFVIIPKNDPRRKEASRLSAQGASKFLLSIGIDESLIPDIAHAIEAHSFSAGITPRTLEAKIVQDADRLDGLGAIGIARCFTVGGGFGRALYSPLDPFGDTRERDDGKFTIDHFYIKLFKTVETLHTEAARKEGQRRAQVMRIFLDQLRLELP